MNPPFRHRQIEGRQGRGGCLTLLIAAIIVFLSLRFISSFAVDYQWWKELGQLRTWFSILAYSVIPITAATILGSIVFLFTHARGLKHAGTKLRDNPLYAKLSTLAAILVALVVALAAIDTWTVVRYFGGTRGGPVTPWHDPVFSNPLTFYLFELPF